MNRFWLSSTRIMVDSGFSPDVLRVIERDALVCAKLIFEAAGQPLQALSDLVSKADSLLPKAGTPQAMQHFFGTQHSLQDAALDDAIEVAQFARWRVSEAKEPNAAIDLYSHSYAGALNAISEMLVNGQVAERRRAEVDTLMNPPVGSAKALLELHRRAAALVYPPSEDSPSQPQP